MAGDLGDFSGTVVLQGAGNMGAAMLRGWLGLGLDPARVVVLEPSPSDEIAALAGRGLRLNPPSGGAAPAEAIVVAVKPQVAVDVMPALAPYTGPRSMLVSIMAGKTLAFLRGAAAPGAALVRAMPNTPAAIGRGITVAVAAGRLEPPAEALAGRLLSAIGSVVWVEDEGLMDAVTAVSGSGPAYVFLLAESLARAGVAAGLPEDLAMRLARETVAGAGELLHRSPLAAETLRRNVTSPGGTTAAALEVLMAADGIDPVLVRAVAAATRRSRQLAG